MKIKMSLSKSHDLWCPPEPVFLYKKISEISISDLAASFLDAYKNTTDDEGEDISETQAFLERVFNHGFGLFLDDFSWAIIQDGKIISGILYALENDTPFIVAIFTVPQYTKKGYAEVLIRRTAHLIFEHTDYRVINLYVTSTNPARSLYDRLGFLPVNDE